MVLGSLSGRACYSFTYGTITVCGTPFQVIRLEYRFVTLRPSLHTGQDKSHDTGRTTHAGFNVRLGLGCFPFARRYSGNRYYFIFLELLRCFSSLRSPSKNYFIHSWNSAGLPHWVSPFGNLRINSYLHLPEAYRSLSRPSSPIDAKAFTIYP